MLIELISLILVTLMLFSLAMGLLMFFDADREIRNMSVFFLGGAFVLLVFLFSICNGGKTDILDKIQSKLTTIDSEEGKLQVATWIDDNNLNMKKTDGFFQEKAIVLKMQYKFWFLTASPYYKIVKNNDNSIGS